MIPKTILSITNCGTERWTSGEFIDAVTCPFVQTMGAAALVLWGFIIFAGLAVYTRTAVMPAVVSMLFVGLASTQIPAIGGWTIMRYVIIVAAALLAVVILRMRG